jgi:hypothetical protein
MAGYRNDTGRDRRDEGEDVGGQERPDWMAGECRNRDERADATEDEDCPRPECSLSFRSHTRHYRPCIKKSLVRSWANVAAAIVAVAVRRRLRGGPRRMKGE